MIGDGPLAERSDGVEVAVLHAALDTECGVKADGSVDASAEEFGKRRDGARIAVLEAGIGGAEPGAVQGAFAGQGLNVESLTVKRPPVLPTAHDEEGVLWVAEIVSAVQRIVELDAQMMPFRKGNAGIHPVQWLVETGDSIERVGEPGVSGVDLEWRRPLWRVDRMEIGRASCRERV